MAQEGDTKRSKLATYAYSGGKWSYTGPISRVVQSANAARGPERPAARGPSYPSVGSIFTTAPFQAPRISAPPAAPDISNFASLFMVGPPAAPGQRATASILSPAGKKPARQNPFLSAFDYFKGDA